MQTNDANMQKLPLRDDLKSAAVLGLAGALSVILLFPYLLQVMPAVMEKVRLPLAIVIPAQAAQAAVIFTLLALVGLRLGYRAGLDAPWLRAWMTGRPAPSFPWRIAISTGLLASVAVVALAQAVDPLLPPRLDPHLASPAASALSGFLASFYGAIGEELQLRLFLMTLLMWGLAKLTRRAPTAPMAWLAIIVAALMFGAGHLPAASHVWPLDTIVIFRTVFLNAIAGVAFGWLYWRRGLEAAMVAHFCADLVLHVATPLLMGATP